MTQQVNVTAFDGAVTPIGHLFVADHVEYSAGSLKALWATKNSAMPEYAQERLTLTSRKTSGGVTRIGLRVDIPVMETPAGGTPVGYAAPAKVAYSDSSEYVQWSHPRSLSQGRLNTKMIMTNLLEDRSTTATPVTGGWLFEAFTKFIFPN